MFAIAQRTSMGLALGLAGVLVAMLSLVLLSRIARTPSGEAPPPAESSPVG